MILVYISFCTGRVPRKGEAGWGLILLFFIVSSPITAEAAGAHLVSKGNPRNASFRLWAMGGESQQSGESIPLKTLDIGKNSLAAVSICSVQFCQFEIVLLAVLNRAAAQEAATDLSLGPPNWFR